MADSPRKPENMIDPEVLSDSGTHDEIVLARDVFPQDLPIIPIVGRPMFPRLTVPVMLEEPDLVPTLMERVKNGRKHVGVLLRKNPSSTKNSEDGEGGDGENDLYSMGVVAEIVRMAPSGEHSLHLLLNTLERFRVVERVQEKPVIVARVEYLHETDMDGNAELKAYAVAVVQAIKSLIQLNPLHKEELSLLMQHSNLSDPGRLADIAAALTTADGAEQQKVLETISIRARLSLVLDLLRKELDVSRIQAKISQQIDEKVSQRQREFFLREQLKAIKKELGIEKEGKEAEADRFEKRLDELDLSDEASRRVGEELEKLRLLEPVSPEFTVTRNYLDWITSLPWGVCTHDSLDLSRAAKVLDADHYGLKDVKERILEFLAVGKLKGGVSGTILCFVGPPGVGKTSLGRSIARAIGRNFYRFSVGGMRDEAEIKGHRRTYIGAMPGKFIQVMKTCGSANPVLMIDEIDKIGASYQGDPVSALLEVLDPEQNVDFLDHYLDVRFDLSRVFFICTANQLDTIPRPLLDRMETINLAGYILEEKRQIARRYLIPKQRRENGLKSSQINIKASALRVIIDGYAREPGVRGLEKHIGKIMRKTARQVVEEGFREKSNIGPEDVETLLGKKLFVDDPDAIRPAVGVVTGLAWTSMGGDTLSVEAINVASDKPGYRQTGQLGDVMLESAQIAYSLVRSMLREDSGANDFFAHNQIHLHVPAGATPKDGPSAGITMATALYSLVTGRPVVSRMAMTGELTLTGRVMPIGGLKEKVIAARRAGIRRLILPGENKKDFEALPDHVIKGITADFARHFTEVVSFSFPKKASRRRS